MANSSPVVKTNIFKVPSESDDDDVDINDETCIVDEDDDDEVTPSNDGKSLLAAMYGQVPGFKSLVHDDTHSTSPLQPAAGWTVDDTLEIISSSSAMEGSPHIVRLEESSQEDSDSDVEYGSGYGWPATASASSSAALTVAYMFEPVSPSGPG